MGLDTISTGSSIAYAMECYERGLLTLEDTGGIELKWGAADVMLRLIELIARREGIGKFIAEGTTRMAARFGRSARDFAVNVKGLDAAMHDARAMLGLAMVYAESMVRTCRLWADIAHGTEQYEPVWYTEAGKRRFRTEKNGLIQA